VLASTGARVVEGELALGHAHERFDEAGQLRDPNLREELQEVADTLMSEVQAREALAA
jgi:hypothetical protein